MPDSERLKDVDDLQEFCRQLTGQNPEVVRKIVEAAGGTVRIREEDGKRYMGTCDARCNRVNLHITDGKTTKVYIG